MIDRPHIPWCTMIVTAWGILAGLGMLQLQVYQSKADAAAQAPEEWPKDLGTFRSDGCLSIIVFVHPHCPCSSATLRELERLVARIGENSQATVVFWHPQGVAADWNKGSLWAQAQRIPGVRVIDDRDSALTRRFGVRTSGQALAYDAAGRLKFSGGITAARGHSGDNAGADAVLAIAKMTDELSRTCSPVFGCSLTEAGTVASISESRP
jgi:hypothetical protein